MLNIQYLREYVLLSETLNFSKASKIMFISQSVLSRHIAIIEKEMGSELFVRNTRNATLTDAGKVVYQNFVELLRIYDSTKEIVNEMTLGVNGILKISSPYYWTQEYTEPLVHKILSCMPKCEIKITSCLPSDGYQDMVNGRSDLAICFDMYENSSESKIKRIPFAFEQMCAFVDDDLKLEISDEMQISDLIGYSFLTLADDMYPQVTENIKKIFELAGVVNPDFSLIPVDQVDTVGMIIHQSKKIGIMMSCLKNQNRSYLICIPLQNESCQIPLYLYYRVDNPNSLIMRLAQLLQTK